MGVRRSGKVSAGYCSDRDVMVTAVAASLGPILCFMKYDSKYNRFEALLK